MKNPSLREKLLKIFNVYYNEESSDKAIIRQLKRRGKIDLVKLTDIVFLLTEEIEALKKPKKKKPSK